MSTIARVLVPTDFSAQASLALRYGCAFARQNEATLYLLHVVQDLAPISIGGGGIAVSAAAEYVDQLEKSAGEALAQHTPEAPGVRIVRQTVIGTPGEQIVDFANANAVDLICVGTHGHGGLKRFFLGSVAERVVQHAACKVLVVRSLERDFVGKDGAPPVLSRILVPVDFSETCQMALNEAASLAARFGAELHLLHVVEDNSPTVSEIALAYPVFQSYVRELVATGQKQMDEMQTPDGVALVRKVVVGDPISKINDYAAEHDVDLVVMGTHGRTGPAHWLMGSVAERVVRGAPCPVLVTPARRNADAPLPKASAAAFSVS